MDNEPISGIVVECNNSTSFAVVKYISSKNRLHEYLLKTIDYDDLIFYPMELRIKKLIKMIRTPTFKIRENAFNIIFFDADEND